MSTVAAVKLTDWDGIGWDGLTAISARVGGRVDHDREPVMSGPRKGERVPCAVITFDGDAFRDTWVHGWACNAGYVAVIA